MNVIAFVVGLILAMVDARAFLVVTRSNLNMMPREPFWRVLLGFVSMLASFSLAIWGFLHIAWYWVVLIVVAGLFAQMLAVNQRTLVPLRVAAPLLQTICIVAAAYLWLAAR